MALKKPKVVLCSPVYGQVSLHWAATRHYATKGDVEIAEHPACSSSLLPSSFNMVLACALDLRDAGRATHMAMCHSDLQAPAGWLDKLWAEMQYHGADFLSVVVPIKNASGDTSTAIGRADDPWTIDRYVRLEDVNTLPPTFGPRDVCGPGEVLLVNTGLWLSDLRRPFWDSFVEREGGFNLHSRIVRREDGSRRVQTRPEDWELSRHMHREGARYLATWKVEVRHEGLHLWSNLAGRRESA